MSNIWTSCSQSGDKDASVFVDSMRHKGKNDSGSNRKVTLCTEGVHWLVMVGDRVYHGQNSNGVIAVKVEDPALRSMSYDTVCGWSSMKDSEILAKAKKFAERSEPFVPAVNDCQTFARWLVTEMCDEIGTKMPKRIGVNAQVRPTHVEVGVGAGHITVANDVVTLGGPQIHGQVGLTGGVVDAELFNVQGDLGPFQGNFRPSLTTGAVVRQGTFEFRVTGFGFHVGRQMALHSPIGTLAINLW